MFCNHYLFSSICSLHDRKICVLGLCCLIDTPGGATRPASIGAVSGEILPAAIMIFNGLKRAYEREFTGFNFAAFSFIY